MLSPDEKDCPPGPAEILESIADPVVAFDREWRFTYVSSRAASILGKTPEDMLGRVIWDLFPADADTGFEDACRRAWAHGKPVVVERYSNVLDLWVENYIYPFENGASTQWRDITARKRAEEALRESESQFRTLGNAIPQLCWIANPDGRSVWHNDRFYEYTGVTPEQLEGWGWQSLHDPRVLPEVIARWEHSVATGEPFEMVYPLRRADGVFRPFLTRITPVRDRQGAIVRWFGTNTDVGDHLKAQEDLAAAIQRLDAHMDNSPLAIVEFDRDLRVTRWSSEAERLFGWTAAEVLGRPMLEIPWVHADDLRHVSGVASDMLLKKRPRNLSANRNYRKDGSVLECEWYNSAIYDANGNLASILSQVLDVTERKRSEERLRQAQKTESVALLAGGVAHDFNNLLVAVMGNASLAAEMLPPDSPAHPLLERVVKAGEHAAHLTRQLLGYAGKGQFVLDRVDLSEVVREVTELVEATAPKKISILLELDPTLPAIEADRSQIHQVLLNLVTNATEAIGDRPGLIVVRSGTRLVDGAALRDFETSLADAASLSPGIYVTLEVRDDGCGMPEMTRARIFDPFFTTKMQGRGLGLAAVAGIVRSHKGTIQVASAPGAGTSFLLFFPALAAPARRPAEPVPLPAALELDSAILIIDDEEFVRGVAARGLERAGCRVECAASGADGIEALARDPNGFAAAILDLSMPGMSGYEVLPRLLALNPRLPVLLMSGYSERDAMRRFQGMAVAGFLQKPFTARQLVEKIASILPPSSRASSGSA